MIFYPTKGFFKAGILTPQGPGTQGVAYMPNISDLLSVSDDFFVDKERLISFNLNCFFVILSCL